jgi:hypothetical protein
VDLRDRPGRPVALDGQEHLVARRLDLGAGLGLDWFDVLGLEDLVELPERRLDALADVGVLVLLEGPLEVVPDLEQPFDQGLGGAGLLFLAALLLALLVVLEVRLLALQP